MSIDLEETQPTRRVIERKFQTSRVGPVINFWTPAPFEDVMHDLAVLDVSTLKILKPNQSDFKLPDPHVHRVSDILSDSPVTGISNQEILGTETARFVLYKGSLLLPAYGYPAEMRFALLQTIYEAQIVQNALQQARAVFAASNRPVQLARPKRKLR